MKQDRLLTENKIGDLLDIGLSTSYECSDGSITTTIDVGELLKAQDAKTAKLLNQQWIEELSRYETADLLLDDNDKPLKMVIIFPKDWQALKSKMEAKDEENK